MDFEQITTEIAEGVLTITLNRPERLNAWTATMGSELIQAFDQADADDEVRVIIVTGAGRGFSASSRPRGRSRVTTAASSPSACSRPPSP